MASSIQLVEDRISDLPDPILCKILSDLPIKNAVATSILSTRWKNLFPFSYLPIHLDLDDSLLPTTTKPNSTSASFIHFVDKVLNATLLDLSSVETIRVCCKGSGYFTKFPDNVSLPNLKCLELNGLWTSHSIQGLLDRCPFLEDLSLVRFTAPLAREFLIQSHVLKNLTISGGSRFETTALLNLDTPNLEMLSCDCFAAKDHLVSKFKSIATAHIDIRPFTHGDFGWLFYSGLHHFADACANTSRMYLGSQTIDMLFHSPGLLPTFQNLNWLGLGYVRNDGWALFGDLLRRAPKEGFGDDERGGGDYLSGFADFAWAARHCDCLEFHLRKIEFCVFNWTNIEMELLEFFLRQGKVLETLIIRGRPLDSRTENRLLSFPNHSKVVLEEM